MKTVKSVLSIALNLGLCWYVFAGNAMALNIKIGLTWIGLIAGLVLAVGIYGPGEDKARELAEKLGESLSMPKWLETPMMLSSMLSSIALAAVGAFVSAAVNFIATVLIVSAKQKAKDLMAEDAA